MVLLLWAALRLSTNPAESAGLLAEAIYASQAWAEAMRPVYRSQLFSLMRRDTGLSEPCCEHLHGMSSSMVLQRD